MTDTDCTRDDARTNGDEPPASARLADLTAFQRDLCWLLAHEAPAKGLRLKEVLARYYDEPVNHSRLYPNLDDLVDAGLVEKGARDRRTNEYRLTAAGRRALSRRRAWTGYGETPSE